MRDWLRHAIEAARIVGDRADLWIPGALAWLAYGGALLFVGSVVPFPTAADLAFFTKDIAVAGSVVPAVLLGMALLGAFVAFLVLHAAGDALLIGELDGRRGWLAWLEATGGVLGVLLVASVPVAAAGLVLSWRLAVVGPAEYQSPDIGGSLPIRIAGGVAPQLVLVLLVLLAAQALAAGATWRVAARQRAGVLTALRGGARDVARAPLRLAGVAVVTLLAHVGYGAIVLLLLRLLFAPIGVALAIGEVRDVAVTALLIGFVAIWLCLILGGGALHAWASSWWAIELDARHEVPSTSEPSGRIGDAPRDAREEAQRDAQQHEGASL